MTLDHIKPVPRFWKFIPFLHGNLSRAIYPNIYLPRKMYENLKSENPDPRVISVIIHERTHLEREKEMGVLRYGLKYIFSKKFRINEELIAIAAEMGYLKACELEYDICRKARHFSSSLYFWSMAYDEAEKILKDLWKAEA